MTGEILGSGTERDGRLENLDANLAPGANRATSHASVYLISSLIVSRGPSSAMALDRRLTSASVSSLRFVRSVLVRITTGRGVSLASKKAMASRGEKRLYSFSARNGL